MGAGTLPETRDQASVRRIQWITVIWMSIEVVVAGIAALRAHSVALLAFGGDSAIELLSGLTVLLRFTSGRLPEEKAARITAVLLFLLALFIILASVFSLTRPDLQPKPSFLGIGLLLAAAAVMPWLARQKARLSVKTRSTALAADAVQSSLCAYLSWVALLGLGANFVFGISWADPAAALVITPIVVKEGWEAWHAKGCNCH